jgi:hypothetical protein
MMPSLSIILPVFNRTRLLPFPLDSLRAAASASPGLEWELIVVDDGSTEDVAAVLARFPDLPIRLHRQENRGLLAARLAGLALARHDAVLFLDGDDAVAPGKFISQLSALGDGDVVYSDVARCPIDADGRPAGPLRNDAPQRSCRDPAEFYLSLQPAPHNPIFRRSYLRLAVDSALFPPDRVFDPIAETWFYYQLSIRAAHIVHAPGAWSIVGEHAGERISRKWERQAWAALRLMQAFMRHCPSTADTEAARRQIGICAFYTWRALPYRFRGFPADEFLSVWRSAPRSVLSALGGPLFQRLAQVLGPATAGRMLRRLQRKPYAAIRTLSDAELATLTQA